MKIRNPWLIKLVALAASFFIRGLLATVRFRYHHVGPDVRPTAPGLAQRYIYALWHEGMLLPAGHYARPDCWILISQHADGEIIAQVCERIGLRTIRGSSTRGGAEAMRQMIKTGKVDHLVITPDGPRGPRRQLQMGLIYLASRTGLPIVPAGIAYRRAWRARSWDRFAVPWPFTIGACIVGVPIAIPAEAKLEALEEYRKQVEAALGEVTELAERWVVRDGTFESVGV